MAYGKHFLPLIEPGAIAASVTAANVFAYLLDDDELMLNVLRCQLTY